MSEEKLIPIKDPAETLQREPGQDNEEIIDHDKDVERDQDAVQVYAGSPHIPLSLDCHECRRQQDHRFDCKVQCRHCHDPGHQGIEFHAPHPENDLGGPDIQKEQAAEDQGKLHDLPGPYGIKRIRSGKRKPGSLHGLCSGHTGKSERDYKRVILIIIIDLLHLFMN